MSPDPSDYKEWKKNGCLTLWMPLTTRNELIAMNSVELKLDHNELISRMDEFGPIIRHVFSPNQTGVLNDLNTRILSFDYELCRKLGMLVSGELPRYH